MTQSTEQRRMMQIASGLGYKVNEGQMTKVEDFEPGDGAVVFTMKGEPIMTGPIEEIRDSDDISSGGLRIGDQWYYSDTYFFRRA